MRAAWVAVGWELLFGATIWAWLRASGIEAPWIGAVCALPALLGIACVRSSRDDVRQYFARVAAALVLPPILLLFWATSLEAPAAVPVVSAARAVDADRLFAGAIAVQDADLSAGGIELMRQGVFADGTEIRLARFPDAAGAARHLAFLGEAIPGERVDDGARRGWRWKSDGLALHVAERHGRDVVEVRAPDAAAGGARLAALGAADSPSVDGAGGGARETWPVLVGGMAAHIAAFVAFVFWAGTTTTALPPAAGAAPVGAAELRERLRSLAASGAPFTVGDEPPDGIVFDLAGERAERRSHVVTLRLDGAKHTVLVRERLGASGARPRNADEASMRTIGDPIVDASRPDAQKVWAKTAQTTLVEPKRLAAVSVELHGGRAVVPAADLAALDGDGLVTLLAAVVTRSGWRWQPEFFS